MAAAGCAPDAERSVDRLRQRQVAQFPGPGHVGDGGQDRALDGRPQQHVGGEPSRVLGRRGARPPRVTAARGSRRVRNPAAAAASRSRPCRPSNITSVAPSPTVTPGSRPAAISGHVPLYQGPIEPVSACCSAASRWGIWARLTAGWVASKTTHPEGGQQLGQGMGASSPRGWPRGDTSDGTAPGPVRETRTGGRSRASRSRTGPISGPTGSR